MFWYFFLPCIHCTEQEQLLMEPWNPAQKGCKILCLNHAIRILVSFPWQSKKCRAAMVWLAVIVWPNESSLRKTRFNPQSTNFCSKKILFFVCVYQHGSKRLQLASVMFSLQVRHWNHKILRIRLIRPSVCIGRHPWHRLKSPRLKKKTLLDHGATKWGGRKRSKKDSRVSKIRAPSMRRWICSFVFCLDSPKISVRLLSNCYLTYNHG